MEALYRNFGDICPLDKLVELKRKYCYRLIIDESLSFGTLGPRGLGLQDHFNLLNTEVSERVTF